MDVLNRLDGRLVVDWMSCPYLAGNHTSIRLVHRSNNCE